MSLERFINNLHKRGLKATPQRIALYEIMNNTKKHPTVEEVYKIMRKKFSNVSLTTIYKNLELFKELDLVQELEYDNKSRYDPNTSPHINIICPKCDEIIDYESVKIKDFITQTVKHLGIKPTGQRFDIYRICERCNNQTQ